MKKVIDIEDRIPTLRERRRKRTNLKFTVLSILFFFLLLILVYFQSPYSDIKKIKVSGAVLVGQPYYLKKSDIQVGESMWSFKASDVEQALEKEPWVQQATVKRGWLTTVNIQIDEWEKVAYAEKDGSFYTLLENGYVFPKANDNSLLDAPVLMGFDNNKVRKKLLSELSKLHPEVLTLISQIIAAPTESDPYTIRLYMNDGFEVRAVISSLVEKLNYYPSIVAQIPNHQKGIIDLEVGSYYRPYDKEYRDIHLKLKQAAGEEGEQEVNQNVENEEEQ